MKTIMMMEVDKINMKKKRKILMNSKWGLRRILWEMMMMMNLTILISIAYQMINNSTSFKMTSTLMMDQLEQMMKMMTMMTKKRKIVVTGTSSLTKT